MPSNTGKQLRNKDSENNPKVKNGNIFFLAVTIVSVNLMLDVE